MTFTIGTPVPGRPPKPDPYRPLAALLESLELGGSLTIPLEVPIADDREKVGNTAISALRRYAEEQGVGIFRPLVSFTDAGLDLSFTKAERRLRKAKSADALPERATDAELEEAFSAHPPFGQLPKGAVILEAHTPEELAEVQEIYRDAKAARKKKGGGTTADA